MGVTRLECGGHQVGMWGKGGHQVGMWGKGVTRLEFGGLSGWNVGWGCRKVGMWGCHQVGMWGCHQVGIWGVIRLECDLWVSPGWNVTCVGHPVGMWPVGVIRLECGGVTRLACKE